MIIVGSIMVSSHFRLLSKKFEIFLKEKEKEKEREITNKK